MKALMKVTAHQANINTVKEFPSVGMGLYYLVRICHRKFPITEVSWEQWVYRLKCLHPPVSADSFLPAYMLYQIYLTSIISGKCC